MKKILIPILSATLIFTGCAPTSENNNQKQEKKDNNGGNPLMSMMGGGGANPMGSMMGGGSGGIGGGQQKIVFYKKAYIGISGLDYRINSDYKTTNKNGEVFYSIDDKKIVFSLGKLTLGEVYTKNIKNNIILPTNFFNIEYNNTKDKRLIKTLIFLESLDRDNNLSNGIQIDNITKDLISNYADEDFLKVPLYKNSLEKIKIVLIKIGQKPIDDKKAIKNYQNLINKLFKRSTK